MLIFKWCKKHKKSININAVKSAILIDRIIHFFTNAVKITEKKRKKNTLPIDVKSAN